MGFRRERTEAVLSVEDSGRGISEDKLRLVGKEGASFGKEKGCGLGLFHANQCAEAWNGKLLVSSRIGQGTQVSLRLPLSEAPKWFAEEIRVRASQKVVVVDDDPSIHEVWNWKLSQLGCDFRYVHHFYDVNAFEAWQSRSVSSAQCLFLIDHDLKVPGLSGLQLITKLGIESSSLLVTSHYMETELQRVCGAAGVRILPKSYAALAQLTVIQDEDHPGSRSSPAVSLTG